MLDPLHEARPLAATAAGQTTFYVHGHGPLAELTGEWTYYLTDGNRTVRQLSDADGAITLARSYTPWGELLEQHGGGDLTWGYFGGLLDAATGLIYVGSGQYYDPETGRFLSPIGGRRNPYVPASPGDPLGAMLGPVALVALLARRRRKGGRDGWLLGLVLVLMMGVSVGLTACGPGPSPSPAPPQPPTTPPEPSPSPLPPTPSPAPTPSPPPSATPPLPPTATPPCSPVQTPEPPTPTPTPSYTDADVDIVTRMVYAEQRSEPEVVWRVAAWAIRNRVSTNYGGYGGYVGQLGTGEFETITEEEAEALEGDNRELFDRIRTAVERVLSGTDSNPMVAAPNAIYFQNTYSPCQSNALEELLNDPEGNVGPGNWGFYGGAWSYRMYYYTYQTTYPANYPNPPYCEYTPTPPPAP